MVDEHIVRTKLRPPEIAKMWGVSVDKIHAWIRSGELRAIDASKTQGGRPRYLIDRAELAAFEERRAVVPPPKYTPRRKRRTVKNIIEYF